MLTYRRGLDGFHVFSDNGQVLFLFSYLLGSLFGSAFLLELPARAARGIVFPFSSFGDAVGRYTRELKIQNTSFRLLTACATGDVHWI